ncbi:hypothetical protein LEP1GSC036_1058 [Leptospira weilii str. 2006001853]|uniref:Uncharacterized protein n=2 Tax=Leptospira weilii TaxID=28184 RepID=A0A828YYC7_9LEPT|nr:hypothetical protein LEP1GSC036_1058 [Leptospira weilii str. 2006001853]EMM73791.1 hypothetical protein LEP1GSC038_1352 [Leptospira weilii str. 2006001855]EMN44921.1 hypothetical protein LEP1GSC086_0143 [Leptospira weilii str. LNT 1234]QDK23421.1 hypothetical protein FHG67_12365 [Leptospira weilii]QDK26937.1 hypothetical protein FHG68_09880 [Leptospira weilii]
MISKRNNFSLSNVRIVRFKISKLVNRIKGHCFRNCQVPNSPFKNLFPNPLFGAECGSLYASAAINGSYQKFEN